MNTAISKTNYQCHQCKNPVEKFPSDIRGKYIFCSKTCSATFYNESRKIVKNCLGCENPFHPVRGSRGKYCSNECQRKHKRKLIYQRIEDGTYQSLNQTILREYLIQQRGNKCEECGWNKIHPITNQVPLSVDHKDGNSENNNPDNIRLLCGSCHTLTPTYGNLNKGHGRQLRRERYIKVSK